MRVTVEYAPAYELVTSYRVFTDTKLHKTLDLGAAWAKATRKLLPEGPYPNSPVPSQFIHHSPHRQDPQRFIAWLASMPVGELYERLLAVMGDDREDIPTDLGAVRDQAVEALAAWHECYFANLDPRIHQGLAADAAAKQALLGTMPQEELVELATGGLCLEAMPATGHVLLVPQYHGRPINLLEGKGPNWAIGYPADPLPPEPGAVPPGLLALTRAVADPSRLQILRFLAEGTRSFTEVVEFAGLAKSTVHHHLVTLRSAGLVRVHMSGNTADRYSLRLDGAHQVGGRLLAYLKGE